MASEDVELVRRMCEAFAGGDWEAATRSFDDSVESGGEVVVSVRDGGRGKGSGASVEREWAQVWTVRNGQVVRFRPFESRAQALEAVGLGG
jgi:ketosteroid isomerase-like protein